MLSELMLLVSLCAQEPSPRDAALQPNTPVAAIEPAVPDAAGPAAAPVTREERLDQIDRLLGAFLAGPSPSSWQGDAASARPADGQSVKSALIVSVRMHARVTSDYVRLIDIADLDHDPEGLAAYVGTIVVCPAPGLEKAAVLARDKVAQRLEEHGLTPSRFLVVGAHQILITRVRAAHEDDAEGKETPPPPPEPDPGAAPSTTTAPQTAAPRDTEASIRRGATITIVRQGSLFTAQEAGTALADGAAGALIRVSDRKGRSFTARVTGSDIVTIQGEGTGKAND